MAKFSIMLFGIDSYTKNKMQLPYKLDAKSSDAALREARMCAMTFIRGLVKRKNRTWRWSKDETFRADKDGQAAACLQCFP